MSSKEKSEEKRYVSSREKNQDLFKESYRQEMCSLDFGFYWENLQQIIDQIIDETREVKEAFKKGDQKHLKEEIGDLLYAALSLSIFCGVDQYEALQESLEKYQKRFDAVVKFVKADGLDNLKNQPKEVLMSYWQKAKDNSSQ